MNHTFKQVMSLISYHYIYHSQWSLCTQLRVSTYIPTLLLFTYLSCHSYIYLFTINVSRINLLCIFTSPKLFFCLLHCLRSRKNKMMILIIFFSYKFIQSPTDSDNLLIHLQMSERCSAL
jgi:hypothetical protein